MPDVTSPHIRCPFPSTLNIHAEHVHAQTIEWAMQFGLVSGEHAKKRLVASKFGWLSARAYPNAAREELEIVANWNTWLFLRDDVCDEAGIGSDPQALLAQSERMLEVLRGAPLTAADDALARALADLRDRLSARLSTAWMQRFVTSVQEYFESCDWEALNRSQGQIPDVETYKAMRRLTGAVNTAVELIDLTERIHLSIEVRKHAGLVRLTDMANNVVCWSNDIFSVGKETLHGDVHNLVLTLKHEEHLSLRQAITRAVDICNAEIRLYEQLEPLIPSFGPRLDEQVGRYLAVLRAWMRGNIDWALESGRYVEADSTFGGVKVDGSPAAPLARA